MIIEEIYYNFIYFVLFTVSEVALIRAQLQLNEKSNTPTPIIGGGAGGGPLVEIPNVNLDERRDLVVIYNRVPKTGSTSFINVAYDLCRQNAYHVLHINVTANMHVLSLANQVFSLNLFVD